MIAFDDPNPTQTPSRSGVQNTHTPSAFIERNPYQNVRLLEVEHRFDVPQVRDGKQGSQVESLARPKQRVVLNARKIFNNFQIDEVMDPENVGKGAAEAHAPGRLVGAHHLEIEGTELPYSLAQS